MDKVLVVHAGFGEGHKIAALSLKNWLGASDKDLLEFCPAPLRGLYGQGYTFITNHFPLIWKALFSSTKNSSINHVLNAINRCIFSSFLRHIRELKPKVIVTTHFFPIPLLIFLKKELNFKIISIVTDFRVHPLWINRGVDRCFVAGQLGKKDLLEFGIEEEKIHCGFVPLREGFLKEEDSSKIRDDFRFDDKPCLLFVSSIRGRFPFIREAIEHYRDDFNIIVIYGRNKRLKKYLESLKSEGLVFFPFYERMWELFSLASIVITKPGGLTVFEGVYKHKPFIFTHYIPGQEEANMKILIEKDVGRLTQDKEQFMEAVDYFYKKKKNLDNNYPIKVEDIRAALQESIAILMKD